MKLQPINQADFNETHWLKVNHKLNKFAYVLGRVVYNGAVIAAVDLRELVAEREFTKTPLSLISGSEAAWNM